MKGARMPSLVSGRLRGGVLAAMAAGTLVASGHLAAEDAAPDAIRLNPLSSLRPSDLQAFREKPLFTPSRRPPPVVPSLPERPPAQAEVGEEAPNVRLTGIVRGGTAAMAILQRGEASGRSSVRIGDDVDGWTVTAIDSVSIRLWSAGREREYRLFARESLPISGPDHAAARDPDVR